MSYLFEQVSNPYGQVPTGKMWADENRRLVARIAGIEAAYVGMFDRCEKAEAQLAKVEVENERLCIENEQLKHPLYVVRPYRERRLARLRRQLDDLMVEADT